MSCGGDLKVRGELGKLLMARGRGVRDHVADDENGGTAGDLFDEIGQFIKPADGRRRIAARDASEHADGRLRRTPGGQEARAQRVTR